MARKKKLVRRVKPKPKATPPRRKPKSKPTTRPAVTSKRRPAPKPRPKRPPPRSKPKAAPKRRPAPKPKRARRAAALKKAGAIERARYAARSTEAMAAAAERDYPGSVFAETLRQHALWADYNRGKAERARLPAKRREAAERAEGGLAKAKAFRGAKLKADRKAAEWRPPRFLSWKRQRFELSDFAKEGPPPSSPSAFPESKMFANANRVLGYLEGRPGVTQLLGFKSLADRVPGAGGPPPELTAEQEERARRVALALNFDYGALEELLRAADDGGIELEVEIDY